MSQFLMMIYEPEAPWETADQTVYDEVMAAHNAFGSKHGARIKGGEALKSTATARTVRGSLVTDGPFLETKEALGGYYLIEADDMDEAVEIAQDVPANFGGCVEVREIMVFS
jgi:hypothetical protein